MIKNQRVAIIENGSFMTKVGFGGDDSPQSTFQSISQKEFISKIALIGKPKSNPGQKNYYVAFQMAESNQLFCQFQPIEFGVIINWKGMENIWDFCFNHELSHECLITESLLNSKENRQKTFSIMFEQFQLERCSQINQQVLSIYSSGLTSGLVIDSGYETTNVVPVIDGKVEKNAVTRNYIGGHDLTKYLNQQLMQSGKIALLKDKQIIKDIKETLCYCALDYQEELQLSQGSSGSSVPFQLPDGQFITLSEELFKTPEILFKSKGIYGKENENGVQELVIEAIKKYENDELADKLYQNINLTGGNCLFPGFQERLQKEITTLTGNSNVKTFAEDKRNISSWVGGSIISQLESFDQFWVSKKQFEEEGAEIVSQKYE